MKIYKRVVIGGIEFMVEQPTLKERFNKFIEEMYERVDN